MEIKNCNNLNLSALKASERFAELITNKIGTIGFFMTIVAWTVCWLGWNIAAPQHLRFDPYPAFVFWLFISNMIQISLMPLIMVGQNIQAKHAEIRAENDYQINLKAEAEINDLKNQLSEIKKLLQQLIEERS